MSVHPIEIFTKNGFDVSGFPSTPTQVFAESQEGLRRHPLDRPPTCVAVVKQVWVAREFLVEIREVEREVGAPTHVVDTDQLNGVLEVACHRLEGRSVGPQENADTGDSNNTASGRTGASLVVGDIARVIPDCPHAGVAVK